MQRRKGEMAEWFNAAVLKTAVPKGTRGSNPCLSANITQLVEFQLVAFFISKSIKYRSIKYQDFTMLNLTT